MADLHYFPLLATDWLAGEAISMMSAEQEGAFIHLLCHAWLTKHEVPCSLPNDDLALAELSRLRRKWSRAGQAVRAQFSPVEGAPDRLRNAKLWAVYEAALERHETAVRSGQAGGKAKAELKRSSSNPTSNPLAGSARATLKQSKSESNTESESKPEALSRTIVQSGEERPRAREDNGSSPPRVVLPSEATAFLAQFYEPAFTDATRKRYRDVQAQLYDVLDPLHPGPKIRGGVRVKARSVEHLQDELRAVMRDPPPDRDLAIVWLLKRLTNPPKGPSVTEVKKREEAADRQLEDQYRAAARRAGAQWANEHPEEYQKILAAVDRNYNGKAGSIVTVARESELTQRCSKEAAFPTFEKWREQLEVPA